MKVRKAVIAAAGLGTRFLPQTKAMPKEMLPIIDKPVIQMVVEEVVAAGVEDIIIVTGYAKRAIEDHFDRNLELEEELAQKGKFEVRDKIKHIAEMANFIYIRQKGEPKGNARPLLNAAHVLGDEPFFLLFADDFFTGNIPRTQQLLDVYNKTGGPVTTLIEIERKHADKYGMAKIKRQVDERIFELEEIIEKPGPENTPSTIATVGGFLLTPDILPILAQEKTGPDGEIRITDAINELALTKPVYGCLIDGKYHDTGNPRQYLESIVDVALDHPKLGAEFEAYLRSRLQ